MSPNQIPATSGIKAATTRQVALECSVVVVTYSAANALGKASLLTARHGVTSANNMTSEYILVDTSLQTARNSATLANNMAHREILKDTSVQVVRCQDATTTNIARSSHYLAVSSLIPVRNASKSTKKDTKPREIAQVQFKLQKGSLLAQIWPGSVPKALKHDQLVQAPQKVQRTYESRGKAGTTPKGQEYPKGMD